jgi:hypothetical protein
MRTTIIFILSLLSTAIFAHHYQLSISLRTKQAHTPQANIPITVNGLATKPTNKFGEVLFTTSQAKVVIKARVNNKTIDTCIVLQKPYTRVVLLAAEPPTVVNNAVTYKHSYKRKSVGKAARAGAAISTYAPVATMMDEIAMPTSSAVPEVGMLKSKAITSHKAFTSMPDNAMPSTTAGTLTTGEVNDFSKWNYWASIADEALLSAAGQYTMHFNKRYTVQVTNSKGKAVINAQVTLYKNNVEEWQTTTDNTGKAELWGDINKSKHEGVRSITVNYESLSYTIDNAKQFDQGINYVQLAATCKASNDVDIAFVVDATGSMGDEIQYLKSELTDVITRAKAINPELNYNMASVFYQDIGDNYVTVQQQFSNNLSDLNNFIASKGADGGGDFPEAVDQALSVAIHELNWRSNARTKILFLVLDAPPHSDSATVHRYKLLLQQAASLGIRIVPITASGIDKQTEFIMRATALATNGTYTFLTNHSGIGNAHISPTTDSFKVEKMNDLLIRLITQFTAVVPCNANNGATSINNDNPFNEWDVTHLVQLFPNPNNGIFYVTLPPNTAEVLVLDNSGKLIKRITAISTNKVDVDITQHSSGIYFVRYMYNNKWYTGKVVKQ